jgi:hypothetical protein
VHFSPSVLLNEKKQKGEREKERERTIIDREKGEKSRKKGKGDALLRPHEDGTYGIFWVEVVRTLYLRKRYFIPNVTSLLNALFPK